MTAMLGLFLMVAIRLVTVEPEPIWSLAADEHEVVIVMRVPMRMVSFFIARGRDERDVA